MEKTWVKDVKEGERVKAIFAVSRKAVPTAKSGKSYEEEFQAGAKMNPAGRFGTPEEFGAACAFLCSVHGGYITGQNWLLDGGGYPGTF